MRDARPSCAPFAAPCAAASCYCGAGRCLSAGKPCRYRRLRAVAGQQHRHRHPVGWWSADQQRDQLGRSARRRHSRTATGALQLGAVSSRAGSDAHRVRPGHQLRQAVLSWLQRRGRSQCGQAADRRHPEQQQRRQHALSGHAVPAGDRRHRGGARHQRPALRPVQHRRQRRRAVAHRRRLRQGAAALRQLRHPGAAAGQGHRKRQLDAELLHRPAPPSSARS